MQTHQIFKNIYAMQQYKNVIQKQDFKEKEMKERGKIEVKT